MPIDYRSEIYREVHAKDQRSDYKRRKKLGVCVRCGDPRDVKLLNGTVGLICNKCRKRIADATARCLAKKKQNTSAPSEEQA